MANNAQQSRSLLRQEGSDLSDVSMTSPIHQRHGYQRMDSQDHYPEPSPAYTSPTISIDDSGGLDHGPAGLGIRDRPVSIPRRPIPQQATSPETPSNTFTPGSNTSPATAPGSANPLLAPAWQRNLGEYGGMGQERDQGLGSASPRRATFVDSPDVALGDMNNDNDNDNDNLKLLHEGCPAKHDIHSSRKTWLSISILILSIYSTIFSAIWLILAMVGPRYGRMIHSGGSFTPATASIVFALLAKTIELSFVTVFVTFLGQVLSRRSLIKQSRGVTLAELTLRTWVIQPGFMFTHGQYLKHAALSLLGGITLSAAFLAMFYTTASDAIVSPHLKYGKPQIIEISGLVQASYANPKYISDNCRTPINSTLDPTYFGTTCLDIGYAGAAYRDSATFMETWYQIHSEGTGIVSSNITDRPQAPAMMFDNTTVTGSWVFSNYSNIALAADRFAGRLVNNVSLSMPHAGVYAAAKAPRNGILQPAELQGLGEYSVRASVVSPSLNVLCVEMTATELEPLVYTTWTEAKPFVKNSTSPPIHLLAPVDWKDRAQASPGKMGFLNATTVDDIFEWGSKYGRSAPAFPQYPIDFNSIVNGSVANPTSTGDSLYLLIKGDTATSASNYTMCQLRGFINPYCSTAYNVSGLTGGHLQSHCGDSNSTADSMAYSRIMGGPNLPTDPQLWINKDWRSLTQEWINSLSLNTGISDANSSTSRMLAKLIPARAWNGPRLPQLLPTIAESLAVMAGHTLLLSSTNSTYLHYWNYSANVLISGTWETFMASVASQQYTSGMQQRWQGIFYVVLFLVFVTNVFCLIYFFLRSGLVTDYTEPQNLFALAVNSPPSERLSGSCGAGPEGDQLNVDWHVLADESTGHFLIKEGEDKDKGYEMRSRRERIPDRNLKSMSSYLRLSSRRQSWL